MVSLAPARSFERLIQSTCRRGMGEGAPLKRNCTENGGQRIEGKLMWRAVWWGYRGQLTSYSSLAMMGGFVLDELREVAGRWAGFEEATLVFGRVRGGEGRWRGSVNPRCRWLKRGDNGREQARDTPCANLWRGSKGTVYLGFGRFSSWKVPSQGSDKGFQRLAQLLISPLGSGESHKKGVHCTKPPRFGAA